MRVIGIDPGTLTLDICGLEDGRPFLEMSLPTAEALRNPEGLLRRLHEAGPLTLIAGPSGYGLPLVPAAAATDADLRLAVLAPAGATGGLGGLGALMRALAAAPAPVIFTPGVVHLASVPAHRKCNRIDMGTADKVCAAVLAIVEQMRLRDCAASEVSLILLELGGAFSAALAVDAGRIVDGLGGSSGPIGARAGGALDGEVAFLMETISKETIFSGGAASIGGAEWLTAADGTLARHAYVEGLSKAAAAMLVSVPQPREIVLSGRLVRERSVREPLVAALGALRPEATVRVLGLDSGVTRQAARGAALLADGLAGGYFAPVTDRLGVRDAAGTVLDHLHLISPSEARRRLGLA